MPKVVWINHELAKSDWKKQNSFFPKLSATLAILVFEMQIKPAIAR